MFQKGNNFKLFYWNTYQFKLFYQEHLPVSVGMTQCSTCLHHLQEKGM